MLYRFVRPLLFLFDPERAHFLSIQVLKTLQSLPIDRTPRYQNPALTQRLWGLTFPNPVGLAAGYDKNANIPNVWHRFGFGFAEMGTITPKQQAGNPRPRIFRIPKQRALVNHLGFNNIGIDAVTAQLQSQLHRLDKRLIPIGFNIGKSKATDINYAVDDYLACCEALLPFADYLVVNVSSPNTPELRKLQSPERLGVLLETLLNYVRRSASTGRNPAPILIKISPELSKSELTEIGQLAISVGVSGVIATNTTTELGNLSLRIPRTGGLSGRPLASRAEETLRTLYHAVEGNLPLIGVGGIFSAQDAYQRIRAGASLIQIYTGMIFEGPFLARKVTRGLARLLQQDGLSHIKELIGKGA